MNSWEHNTVDITMEFEHPFVGSVGLYLRNRWETTHVEKRKRLSMARRQRYGDQGENAVRLRRSVRNLLSPDDPGSPHKLTPRSLLQPVPEKTEGPVPEDPSRPIWVIDEVAADTTLHISQNDTKQNIVVAGTQEALLKFLLSDQAGPLPPHLIGYPCLTPA